MRSARKANAAIVAAANSRRAHQLPLKNAAPLPDPIGSLAECWCGQQAGHPWPGKSDGLPHPPETTAGTPPASRKTNTMTCPACGSPCSLKKDGTPYRHWRPGAPKRDGHPPCGAAAPASATGRRP